jgi:hypothetical protein
MFCYYGPFISIFVVKLVDELVLFWSPLLFGLTLILLMQILDFVDVLSLCGLLGLSNVLLGLFLSILKNKTII